MALNPTFLQPSWWVLRWLLLHALVNAKPTKSFKFAILSHRNDSTIHSWGGFTFILNFNIVISRCKFTVLGLLNIPVYFFIFRTLRHLLVWATCVWIRQSSTRPIGWLQRTPPWCFHVCARWLSWRASAIKAQPVWLGFMALKSKLIWTLAFKQWIRSAMMRIYTF